MLTSSVAHPNDPFFLGLWFTVVSLLIICCHLSAFAHSPLRQLACPALIDMTVKLQLTGLGPGLPALPDLSGSISIFSRLAQIPEH